MVFFSFFPSKSFKNIIEKELIQKHVKFMIKIVILW